MERDENFALEIDGEFLSGIAAESETPCRDLKASAGTMRVFNDFGSRTVSRLMGYVIGVTRPPPGAVNVLGYDVGSLSKGKTLVLRRRLGIAAGQSALVADLTVAENISLPCQLKKLSARQVKTRVRKISEALRLDDLLGIRASGLGIVEQRIVLLARALAHDPELILLEAPLVGLPDAWRSALVEQFKRLSVTGSTVVVFHEDNGEFTRRN